jgi:hypothetical protein
MGAGIPGSRVGIRFLINKISQKGDFWGYFYVLYSILFQCFFCHHSDYAISEDGGIELRIVVASALAVRSSIPSLG